jgi:hypothetical protein
MKKILFLTFLFLVSQSPLFSGVYMIVVAELRPTSQTKQSIDTLRQVLIDQIFDVLFETGHIAFDVPPSTLNGWTPEWRLSHIREAQRYGATRVVIIRIEWEEKRKDFWNVKSFQWAILDARNRMELSSGTLEMNFFSEGETELSASVRIAQELMKGFRVGLLQ